MALEIRITSKLPFPVIGPRTKWIVYLDFWGKNDSKCQLVARCLTHDNIVTFYGGRAADNVERHRLGFRVRPGIEEKLACAMVAQGHAEIVQPFGFFEREAATRAFPGDRLLR